MPPRPKTSFWHKCRVTFRWCRILVWLLLLALVVAVIYLTQFGLPDFAKQGIVAELRVRGVDVEFERLRWRWFHGIVGERISLGRAGRAGGPQFAIAEAEVRLDHDSLKNFQFKVTSVLLRDGNFTWPLRVTNQPPRDFKLENITTELRFLPDDQWELNQFTGVCQGIRLRLGGVITNASKFRERKPVTVPPTAPAAPGVTAEERLRDFVAVLERIQFAEPPELTLRLGADAAPGGAVEGNFELTSARTRTPWGECARGALTGHVLRPAGSNAPVSAELKFTLQQPKTEWAQAAEARLALQLRQSATNAAAWRVTGELAADDARTRWAAAARARCAGFALVQTSAHAAWETSLNLTATTLQSEWGAAAEAQARITATGAGTDWDARMNLTATLLQGQWGSVTQAQANVHALGELRKFSITKADGDCSLEQPVTRWASAQAVKLSGEVVNRGTSFQRPPGASREWWSALEPFQIDWNIEVLEPAATNLHAGKISGAGAWRPPEMFVEKISAELYGGRFDADGQLNLATRQLSGTAEMSFDMKPLVPLMSTNTQRFFNQFEWEKPPRARADISLLLPPWKARDRSPDWQRELLGTLLMSGHFDADACAYRSVPASAAQSDFVLSNSTWRLPNLTVRRPEGVAVLDYFEDIPTRDYHWGIRSGIDPNVVKPLLEPAAQRVLGFLQLTRPPQIEGDIWGRWYSRERTGFNARLALTNFIVRGEGVSNFTCQVALTNQWLRVRDLAAGWGERLLTAPQVDLDLDAEQIYITNVWSTADPLLVTRIIGPVATAAIEPYHFHQPPRVRLNGRLPFQDVETTDLHFEVEGGPFSALQFNLPQISGAVHWVTNKLHLEGVRGDFYGGDVLGNALFDFSPRRGADFGFSMTVTNGNLNGLMADISSATNKLEGNFSGALTITAARTDDWKSWQGFGTITMTNGLLWDFPMFGLFTPVLNAFAPGLGSSRASEAAGTFIITNSVIHTADLEIRAAPVRLHYDGSVDFDTRVNATVTAEMFRDMWLLGRLLSLATMPLTKIFEYKVAGTLAQPKTDPLYVPKLFLLPLHPIKTLKDIFTPDGDGKTPPAKAPAKEKE
ncbi:MAG: hypothetical protein HZA89_03050 [Verrucomicrobia bacterium]|nr:hypothetical protein [Verrucomicrobiota bacterium]